MKQTEQLAELRQLKDDELGTKYSAVKRELYDARIRLSGMPTSEIQRLRKMAARLHTIARERGLAIH